MERTIMPSEQTDSRTQQPEPTVRRRALDRFTHAAAVELLNAVTEGMLYYLSTFNDPDSERLGNALRLATDMVFETLPAGHTDVWT